MTDIFKFILSLALLAGLSASPARADRCDDLAAQLKGQIDGLGVGKTAANAIFLSHPAAQQIRLGCFSRNVAYEISATSEARKPAPAFVALVASAAAVVFTIPKPDTVKGVSRCLSRMGLLHGDDVSTRYRRLDMHCSRTKTTASITISRSRDE